MSELSGQIRADMVAAMKAHDTLTLSTLRMAISAIQNEEVAGKQARELTDADVVAVLNREVSKRRDSAESYTVGNRPELATKELGEVEVLQRYLPAALSDTELAVIVAEELGVAQGALGDKPTMKQMGLVMKAVTKRVAGRADGGKVATLVRSALA